MKIYTPFASLSILYVNSLSVQQISEWLSVRKLQLIWAADAILGDITHVAYIMGPYRKARARPC